MTFDYSGRILPNGQHEIVQKGTFRTSLGAYAEALVTPRIKLTKENFLALVEAKAAERKAGITKG